MMLPFGWTNGDRRAAVAPECWARCAAEAPARSSGRLAPVGCGGAGGLGRLASQETQQVCGLIGAAVYDPVDEERRVACLADDPHYRCPG